jgi:hypothetical protein
MMALMKVHMLWDVLSCPKVATEVSEELVASNFWV